MLPEIVLGINAPSPKQKEQMMDYTEKLERLDEHLMKHPTDYQARIAKLKAYSNAVDHKMYLRKVARLKKVAKYRRDYGSKFDE